MRIHLPRESEGRRAGTSNEDVKLAWAQYLKLN